MTGRQTNLLIAAGVAVAALNVYVVFDNRRQWKAVRRGRTLTERFTDRLYQGFAQDIKNIRRKERDDNRTLTRKEAEAYVANFNFVLAALKSQRDEYEKANEERRKASESPQGLVSDGLGGFRATPEEAASERAGRSIAGMKPSGGAEHYESVGYEPAPNPPKAPEGELLPPPNIDKPRRFSGRNYL